MHFRLQTRGKMQTEGEMQTEDCRSGVKCRLGSKKNFRSVPDQGCVSNDRLAIIFMAIDVSNFTSSDGFGLEILF